MASSESPRVSVATAADITPGLVAATRELVKSLHSANQVPIDAAFLSTIVESNSSQLLIASDAHKTIQGLAILVIYPTLTSPRALVETLVVDPNFRREGIATALIQTAIKIAAERKVRWVRFAASTQNQASNQLLQKLGAEMTPDYNEYGFPL